MARGFSFTPGEYYHIYNRGVDKRVIFKDQNDHDRFVVLLYLCNDEKPLNIREFWAPKVLNLNGAFKKDRGERIVDIGAYCLMPNHFHLLAYERKKGGTSTFMHKLQTAYSMYFNAKYERMGALFEGRFKARIVNKEAYIEYLFAYIHLNPVKIIDPAWKEEGIADVLKARDFLSSYRYSSYLDFSGTDRPEGRILEQSKEGPFGEYFKERKEFSDFLDNWLSSEDSAKDVAKEKAWKAIKPEDVK